MVRKKEVVGLPLSSYNDTQNKPLPFCKRSELSFETSRTQWQTIEFREGGNPSAVHKIPGRSKYDSVTLEEGVTHDITFESWANMVHNMQGDAASSPKNYRKDIILEMLNEQGTVVLAYKLYRCWVSEYQALPELNANSSEVAIRSIRIENEGWERDTSIPEPAET